MPKVKVTSKGLIQEPGSGFEFQSGVALTFNDASTFSGSISTVSAFTSSAGLVCRPPNSGAGAPFSLDVTSSAGSDGSANAIRLWSTSSAQGADFGIGATQPAGCGVLYFDPDWQPVGGSATGALKVLIGSTHYVLSMSAI